MLDIILVTDATFKSFAERNGLTEEELIEAMVSEGWEIGSDHDGWNEFWPPN